MATIPSRKATFTEEEKRKLVEGTDAQGKPLSESEKMKLSKMHTARTLGADWREKAAERMKAEEPARAQQALAERAAINRSLTPREYKLPTNAGEEITTQSGGKVKFGAETLKRMQGFEKERASKEQARQEKFQKGLASVQQEAKAALRKRYEDELAARGFAPPKTRQEQEAIDRAKMDEFRVISAAKRNAEQRSSTAKKDFNYYDSLAKQAAASGKIKEAEDLAEMARGTGGFIKSSSARMRFIEDQEMSKARALINEKTKTRMAKMKAQNTSTPEAVVGGFKDSVARVNQEPLSLLPPPQYQVFAGAYGKGAAGRYVKAGGPTAMLAKEKSKVKTENEVKEKSTPLSASIKQLEKQEATAGVESNKKKIQEIDRKIAELSKTSTRPIGSELPFRNKTLKELRRDENEIIKLNKLKESLNR